MPEWFVWIVGVITFGGFLRSGWLLRESWLDRKAALEHPDVKHGVLIVADSGLIGQAFRFGLLIVVLVVILVSLFAARPLAPSLRIVVNTGMVILVLGINVLDQHAHNTRRRLQSHIAGEE